MKSIHLWSAKPESRTDDAGIQISVTEFPSLQQATPLYESSSGTKDGKQRRGTKFKCLPALQHFCIKALVDYPEEIYVIGSTRLQLNEDYDLLHSLIPQWSTSKFSIARVDPRLWAVLVQIYSNLPPILSSYPISLGDKHLPLLQFVPPTQDFALITVLDLRRSKALTDDSIIALKALHNLCVLDAKETSITADGIRRLALTVTINGDGERRGPWTLRVLRLVDCRGIGGAIFRYLSKFPLLTALDLRGTLCEWKDVQAPFRVSQDEDFFEPRSALDAAQHLAELSCRALPSTNYRTLQVFERLSKYGPSRRTVDQPERKAKTSLTTSVHNSFVVLPASTGSTSSSNSRNPLHQASRIQTGNADLLEGGEIGLKPEHIQAQNLRSLVRLRSTCRVCRKPPRPEEVESETTDSEDDILDNPFNYEGMEEAHALYLQYVELQRNKKRSSDGRFCYCDLQSRPFIEPLERMGMTVAGPSNPSSFYQSRRQKPPARRMEHMRSTGLKLSRSPPDWDVLEDVPRIPQRPAPAVPSANTMVATKASLKSSGKLKAWNESLGKRKREIAPDTPRPAVRSATPCNPSFASPLTESRSPPRKCLKPISNMKPPDAPPPKAKTGPRLKLEPADRLPKTKVVPASRVTNKSSTPTSSKHKGHEFDLRNAFDVRSKSDPVNSGNAKTDKPVATSTGRKSRDDRSSSKPKFDWSDWGRKS